MRPASSKKTIFSVLTFCLLLLLIELMLRLGGAWLDFRQYSKNKQNDSAITILTLGESTTADGSANESKSWPRILEEKLQARGWKVSVVNEAKAGTTSSALVAALPTYLQKHSPNIVISMMGINDISGIWLNRAGIISNNNFFQSLRIVKLMRLLFFQLEQRPEPEQIPSNSFKIDPELEKKIISQAQSKKQKEALALAEEFLQGKTAFEKGQFFSHLGQVSLPDWSEGQVEKFLPAMFWKKNAIQENPKDDINAMIFLVLAQKTKSKGECHWLLEEYLKNQARVSDLVIGRLMLCVPEEVQKVQELAQKSGSSLDLRNGFDLPTAQNYRFFQELLAQANVCGIAMQYPRMPVDDLKRYFQGVQESSRTEFRLISNEQNFQEALSRERYEDLFSDRFAGAFGHCTEKGNSLIAENLVNELEKIHQQKKCGLSF